MYPLVGVMGVLEATSGREVERRRGAGRADTRAVVVIRIRVDGVDLTGLLLFALGGKSEISASEI